MEPTSDVEGIEATELRKTALSQSKTNGEDPKRQESPSSAATKQHRRTAAQVQEKGYAIHNHAAIARKAAEDQAASGPAPPTATNRTPKRVRFLDDDAASQTTIKARYSAMEDFFRNLSSGATQVPIACGNATIIEKQIKEMLEMNKKLVSTTQTTTRLTTAVNEFMSNFERSLQTHCDKDTSSRDKSKST